MAYSKGCTMSQTHQKAVMHTGRFEKAAKHFPIWKPLLIVLILILSVILLLSTCNQSPTKEDVTPATTEQPIVQNPDSIAIPGYEILELKADSKTQTICLPNPPQNMCYFQISLYLENGTLLWQSDLIEPGDTSAPIQLNHSLKKGSYPNSILKYSCFKMDESLSPLNGAETKLTLWVK